MTVPPTPAPITAAQINDELNASLSEAEAAELINYALEQVAIITAGAILPVPPASARRAVLAVIADEWALRQAPGGVRAFAGADGGVVRVSLDTARRARVILRPWTGLGIA